jgi:hypothetical protein
MPNWLMNDMKSIKRKLCGKTVGSVKDNPRSKDVQCLLGKALLAERTCTHPPNDLNYFLDEFGAVGDDEDKKRQAEVHSFYLFICSHQSV